MIAKTIFAFIITGASYILALDSQSASLASQLATLSALWAMQAYEVPHNSLGCSLE